eukprot:9340536-Pyramimonas_sp.AAC.1
MSGIAKAAPGKDVEANKSAPNYGGVVPLPIPPVVARKPKDSTLLVWVLGFLLVLGIGATVTFLVISIDKTHISCWLTRDSIFCTHEALVLRTGDARVVHKTGCREYPRSPHQGLPMFTDNRTLAPVFSPPLKSDDDDSDDKTHELRGEIDEFDSDSDDFQPPPPSELVGIAASAAPGINSVWEPYITLLLRVDFEL